MMEGRTGRVTGKIGLNGGDGMADMLGHALTMGGAALGIAQQLIASIKGDKPATTPVAAVDSVSAS